MLGLGVKVRSRMDHTITGVIVGYGVVNPMAWIDAVDGPARPVYIVSPMTELGLPVGSHMGGPAVFVLEQDRTELL